ncbi:MAG: tetratricopeptide repeat protein [Verrucomicrobiota bacterium]
MVAHSQRQLKNYAEAIRLYGAIERDHPGTKEATEAGFRKLQCFHVVGDEDLPLYVDRYVGTQSKVDPNTPYLDLALLLKAERLFENKKFAEAAEAYGQVRPDKIDESYGPDRLYKMAWALVDGGKLADGIQALGDFIGGYKDDPRIPSVLAKRASAHLKAENLDAALADYQKLADDFPKDENAEYALHQSARIYHQKAQLKEMVGAYQKLLERFPETVIKGEANYWIGSGLFEVEEYEKSILPLNVARELYDKDKDRTSLRLILAHYHLRDIPTLLAETKAFRAVNKDLKIPIQVYAVLGRELYKQSDFRNAEEFLLLTAKPEMPLSTPVDIWDKLSKIYLDSGKNAEAIQHLDYFLAHQHHPETEARAKLDKAGCQLKLKKTEEATAVGEEVLDLVRQGRLNAEARILLGDIAMAEGDAQRASELYVIVCQLVNDPVMTPRAMDRMIKALEKLGRKEEAEQYRTELKDRFPNYQPAD